MIPKSKCHYCICELRKRPHGPSCKTCGECQWSTIHDPGHIDGHMFAWPEVKP